MSYHPRVATRPRRLSSRHALHPRLDPSYGSPSRAHLMYEHSPGAASYHPSPIADAQFSGVLAVCIQNPPCRATPQRPVPCPSLCQRQPVYIYSLGRGHLTTKQNTACMRASRSPSRHSTFLLQKHPRRRVATSDSTSRENAGRYSDHLGQARKHYRCTM